MFYFCSYIKHFSLPFCRVLDSLYMHLQTVLNVKLHYCFSSMCKSLHEKMETPDIWRHLYDISGHGPTIAEVASSSMDYSSSSTAEGDKVIYIIASL